MEITDIKEQLTIETVLDNYGLKPNKNGMLCCPFHDDKTPSLQIYPKTNTFCCFSSNCNAGTGDVIQFIELKEKCTKHEALLKAKELLGYAAEPKKQNTEILTKLFSTFSGGIKQCKPALAYLEQRNLNLSSNMGYNGGRFHQQMQETAIDECLQLGLLKPFYKNKSGKQLYKAWAKDCVVFPLKDQQNKIVSFYARSLKEEGNSKHFYLPNRKGLYPNYPSKETTKLILTESIIDAETLLQSEIAKEYEVLALYGTNGLTTEHIEAIRNLKLLEDIVLWFDGDQAGIKAVEKYAKELQLKQGLVVSQVKTPDGEDINSLLDGHEPEILTELLNNRETLVQEKEQALVTNQEPPTALSTLRLGTLDCINPEKMLYENPELQITVWGGIELDNLTRLRVSLFVQSKNDRYLTYRDDVNLYSHSSSQKTVRQIAETLELPTTTISRALHELTEGLEQYRMEQRAERIRHSKPKPYEMSDQEKKAAQAFLKDKHLVKKTLQLITQSGLVGEAKNGLLLYFLYLSRLQTEPLHAIIFGKSGSGKTYLQTKISECLPEESVRTITSLTENTLYYSSKGFWKHKVLLIEDLDGVYNAFLPLREFMSKQSITKLTTDKDAKGNNVQKVLTVEGPICVSGATTKAGIYEDNANRSFLLHIDESPEHLNEVMQHQRKAQAGMINESEQQTARQLLQNAQRLLHQVKVVNPYALELSIPDCVFKKLRTNMHYLKLIEIITFYHQAQRQRQKGKDGKEYIKTELKDIEIANSLVKESLLRKSDELSDPLRQFFERLKSEIQQGSSFYAKQVREAFRMNPMQVNRYLRQLDSMGYIQQTGGNRKTGFEYQIKAWEEYEKLKEGINILDEVLERLKAKRNGSITKEKLSITSV